MAHSPLVSIPSSNVSRNITYPLKDKQSSQRSFKEKTSLDHQQNSKVSGMENVRDRLPLSRLSRTASRRKIDLVSCDTTPILDFLGKLFGAGYEYRTIKSHWSAILAYHHTTDGKVVGSNGKVCKLLSGVFNLLQTVLEYIKVNFLVNNVLLEKLVSLKLSMILALASASKATQIQHLDISQMGQLPDQYKFVYTKLHKSWRKSKSPPSVSFFA